MLISTCKTDRHTDAWPKNTQQPRSARTHREINTLRYTSRRFGSTEIPQTLQPTPLHRSNTGSPSRGAFAFGWPPPALWEPSSRGTGRRGKIHKQNDKFMTSQDSYLEAARGQRRGRKKQRNCLSCSRKCSGSILWLPASKHLHDPRRMWSYTDMYHTVVALTKQQCSPHLEWEQHDTFRKYIHINKEKDSMITVWPSSAPEVCCTSQELEGKKEKNSN